MVNNMENNDKAKNTNRASFVLLGLSIFNAVHSAYIINYKPKIGAHHIWLCSAFGVVLVLFSVWAIIYCVGLLIKKEGKKGLNIALLLLTVLLLITGVHSSLPFCKDFIGGRNTVTTDNYLAINDKLYFLDDKGNKITLTIPNDTASEFRSKENYEYDYVNNLLKYYDTITVTYYPNSGVIIDLSSEN